MKITYADANRGYLYYTDLYKSLCKLANVKVITGPQNSKSFRIDKLDRSSDALIFGLGWMSQSDPNIYGKMLGLRQLKMPVVCLLHKPQNLLKHKLRFCKTNHINLLVYSQKEYKRYGKIAGVPAMQSWMAGDQMIYKDRGIPKIYDFGFSGALHGGNKIKGRTRNLRSRIQALVKARPGLKLFWNGSDSVAPRIKSVKAYARRINQCKIWLTTTGPLEDISPRYFEIGLSKTLIFCNRMGVEHYNNVFRDGENCVMFKNDLSDFNSKLTHYLNRDAERQAIIDTAYNEFISAHTWDCRAAELIGRIQSAR